MEALTYLAIIWCSVYVAVWLAKLTRLTPVLYFLALGALMVNTGILPAATDPFIRGFADIGIIIIMFALGFEETPGHFIRSIKRSWGIAFFGGIAPFAAAYAVAEYFWGNTAISIMCGLAMTSTAISLTMVSLKSEGLHTSFAAKGIITSALLEDIASLALLAVLVPIVVGQASVSLLGIWWIVTKAALFFVLVAVIGLCVFPHESPRWRMRIPLIGRYGIKHFFSFAEGEHTTLAVLLVALLVGLLAHYFGFHPAVGAYMAGLILKEEYFQFHNPSNVNYYERTKRIVDSIAFSWIGPVFFVNLGANILFDWNIFVSIIPQTIALTASIIVAQILSSSLAARYTGHFSWPDSILIGAGMLGRAELAFVVMDIAYVQHAILSTQAFYTLMFSAFWLNVLVPVSISLWKKNFGQAMPV
jgi:Kef-type K+ transport system membrane component KefB